MADVRKQEPDRMAPAGVPGFEQLFRQAAPGLWRTIFAFAGGRAAVADDAVAEAFARALERFSKTAYVAGMNTVTPISVATGTPGKPVQIHCCAVSMAVTPDGRTVYVGTAQGRACSVVPISTATNTAGKPIRLGSRPPGEMAMTPDGKTVYVANPEGPPGAAVPISTATNTVGKPIGIGPGLAIAISGKTLYAAAWLTSGVAGHPKIVPVSTVTNTPGKPITLPIRVGPPYRVLTP